MIEVEKVINDIPHFESFCSVAKWLEWAERLRSNPGFAVEVVGTSHGKIPIHHIRCGEGTVKVLVVAGPHSHEPVGGLTVSALLTLLERGDRKLLGANVQWHIVPCADPDGAVLNEGWTQNPFDLGNYMRNFHLSFKPDTVDGAFPIQYKKLIYDRPTPEARALGMVLERVRPDFYFWLHNAYMGGIFALLSEGLDSHYYRQLHALWAENRLTAQSEIPYAKLHPAFERGILQWPRSFTKRFYDFLEESGSSPEQALRGNGATSVDYLDEIKGDAFTFACEVPYLKHPSAASRQKVGGNLRQLKLRIDADNKYLATIILEAWDRVKADLNLETPLYRDILMDMAGVKERLCEEAPASLLSTKAILNAAQFGKEMTEGERFDAYVYDRFHFLRRNYGFVRVLKASNPTPEVRRAIERLDMAFDEALSDMDLEINFKTFETVDHDTLAKVQLGSGLIALNAVLERRSEMRNRISRD